MNTYILTCRFLRINNLVACIDEKQISWKSMFAPLKNI